MFKLVFPALLLSFASCGAFGDVIDRTTLSEAELQEVKDNYDGAMRAFQDLGDFAADVADGTVDISGSTYDPPTAGNGWQGTLRYQGPDFPGGDGDITLRFTALDGTGQPVDPFSTDVADDTIIAMDVGVDFLGTTTDGAPLAFRADFALDLDRTDPDREVVAIDGTFTIRHGEYVAELVATAFSFSWDPLLSLAGDATGRIEGAIDIPGFAFDADVDIVGQGESLQVHVAVLDQTVEDAVLDINDFQATGS
jgi:hypothetical protein